MINVLHGKGLQVYDSLSVDSLEDYEGFKSVTLAAYDLWLEAYMSRQLFWSCQKCAGDTYVKLACCLCGTVDKLLQNMKVTKLKDLVGMKQFTNCANRNIGTLLIQKRIHSIKEAATRPDNRTLSQQAAAAQYGSFTQMFSQTGCDTDETTFTGVE